MSVHEFWADIFRIYSYECQLGSFFLLLLPYWVKNFVKKISLLKKKLAYLRMANQKCAL